MRRPRLRQNARAGAIAPLTALLLIPLLGMVAFAVDMGWITHTQNQLQSSADAAALAGAGQLPDGFVKYYLPGQKAETQAAVLSASTATARTYAKNYAGYNAAGDVSALKVLDGDVEFGYTDAAGNYTPQPDYKGFPNTVKVTVRRDAHANGPLGLFFARVIGTSSVNLTATASATIYGGSVDSFSTAGTLKSRILPMTYDVNAWNNFLQTGQAPDGSTSFASDGNPELAVYPSLKDTGNFGQLSLDQSNDGASVIKDWIHNGVSAADLKANVTAGLLPLSAHSPSSPPDWKGNPGMKSSTIHAVAEHVGELYLLPLFKPVSDGSSTGSDDDSKGKGKGKGDDGDDGGSTSTGYQAGSGNGSHYYYTVVQFVGVRISTGDKDNVRVQPSALIDPNAILTGLQPASPPTSSSRLITTFGTPKLTR